jgi:hypothetical protein
MTTALDLCHGKAIDGLRWLAVLYAADRIGLYHHRRVASQHYSLAGQLLAFRRINRAGCDVLYKSVLVEQLSSSEGRNESVVKDRLKRNQQNGRHERMHLTLKKEATRPAEKNFLQQQAKFDRLTGPRASAWPNCPAG